MDNSIDLQRYEEVFLNLAQETASVKTMEEFLLIVNKGDYIVSYKVFPSFNLKVTVIADSKYKYLGSVYTVTSSKFNLNSFECKTILKKHINKSSNMLVSEVLKDPYVFLKYVGEKVEDY